MRKMWWQRPETAGPSILLLMAIAGMVVANSPWQSLYALLERPLGIIQCPLWGGSVWQAGLPSISEAITLGPMTLFFLIITLDLKKEIVSGHLSQLRQCLLPCLSALGGVIVPAVLYMAIAEAEPALRAGWAIPIATDAAFTVPILLSLGRYVSEAGRIWLMALAIFDDVLGILIIALFYGGTLHYSPLCIAIILTGGLVYLGRQGEGKLWPYSIGGVLLWGCLLFSGLHPTLAGVVVGLALPATSIQGQRSPLERMEHYVAPWVTWLILPVFGFVIMGVPLVRLAGETINIRLVLAVTVGLVVGKAIGIFSATWCVIQSGLASLPQRTSWRMLFGLSLLCGVGFTVSLFIASLAFSGSALLISAKLGILGGSLIAALCGWLWLRIWQEPTG